MSETPAFNEAWLQAKSLGLLTRVETLKKGDRFVDCYGVWLTYEKVDGAGPGATHHARPDLIRDGRISLNSAIVRAPIESKMGAGKGPLRLLAGWCEVLVCESCPNHVHRRLALGGLPYLRELDVTQSEFRFSTQEATRVLVTGSRFWTDRVRLEDELRAEQQACFFDVVFIIGDCDTGVDRMTLEWCKRSDVDFQAFVAGKVVGKSRLYQHIVARLHARNRMMVEVGRPQRFLAFWDGRDPKDGEPSGTLDTMKRCVRARIPGRIVPM